MQSSIQLKYSVKSLVFSISFYSPPCLRSNIRNRKGGSGGGGFVTSLSVGTRVSFGDLNGNEWPPPNEWRILRTLLWNKTIAVECGSYLSTLLVALCCRRKKGSFLIFLKRHSSTIPNCTHYSWFFRHFNSIP